jgi:hypothetical protein
VDEGAEAVDGESEAEREAERREVVRETTTMALYVSLSQVAFLTALPSQSKDDSTLAMTVALTSVGLVVAHQVAFKISSRLVAVGNLEPLAPRLLRAQLSGGAFVTLLAVIPLVLFGSSALWLSITLLLAFVAIVGYLAARSIPVSRARAMTYVVMVILAVGAVLAIKSLVNH